LPTKQGTFNAVGYHDLLTGAEHVALASGEPLGENVLVRIHSECLTGDVFGSMRCDCGSQLEVAMSAIAERGGVVVYLGGHEGRGIGRVAKLAAYALQDQGHDTVDANLLLGEPADGREYGAAAAILVDLGIRSVHLLTNNPAKVVGLRAHGVLVAEQIALQIRPGPHNMAYLSTKRQRLGHDLTLVPLDNQCLGGQVEVATASARRPGGGE
jgi:3,4-dihydroxy 2-butanone 4-phosphate synthase/GTP cyclohydrolase II